MDESKIAPFRLFEIRLSREFATELLPTIKRRITPGWVVLLDKITETGPHAGFWILRRGCSTTYGISIDFETHTGLLQVLFAVIDHDEDLKPTGAIWHHFSAEIANPNVLKICTDTICKQLAFYGVASGPAETLSHYRPGEHD